VKSDKINPGQSKMRNICRIIALGSGFAICCVALSAQAGQNKAVNPGGDDSNVRPPVTEADLRIAKRAREILDMPSKWNRADTRDCPAKANTFSLYCALERATDEVSGNFKHRGAAMQEARFVIDDVAPNAKTYEHRLMGYNNDPTTSFADIQRFFTLLQDRLKKRLADQEKGRDR
jgi:hypothetical protein